MRLRPALRSRPAERFKPAQRCHSTSHDESEKTMREQLITRDLPCPYCGEAMGHDGAVDMWACRNQECLSEGEYFTDSELLEPASQPTLSRFCFGCGTCMGGPVPELEAICGFCERETRGWAGPYDCGAVDFVEPR